MKTYDSFEVQLYSSYRQYMANLSKSTPSNFSLGGDWWATSLVAQHLKAKI